jgi:uncharacterized membrane protein
MKLLASLFVGKPLNILLVAALFFAGYLVARQSSLTAGRRPHALLAAVAAWVVYAAWEWAIQIRTPEANIRADLLAIWPVLVVVSVWAVIRSLR